MDPLYLQGSGGLREGCPAPRGSGTTLPDQSSLGSGAKSLWAVSELQRVADLGQKKGHWERGSCPAEVPAGE